ncbi:MAG TPA: GNAT family N-acetyltransferase [Rhodopila sp.]|nr:GNAT family N-acetyltransferase [Rhodopila sp.]
MVIEQASSADADLMAAIHAAAFPQRECWSADIFRLQLALPGVLGLIYPDAGFVLVRIVADESEILTLAVTPARRRQNIGTMLLSKAIEAVRLAGADALFLEVSVVNKPARALYTHAGFVEVGRRPRYYADGTDALVLRRDCR